MKVKLIYIALVSLFAVNSAFSQWVQTDGPYGTVNITSLFVHSDRLFASSSCGLYSTPSPSAAWNSLASINIKSYDINGNNVYFGENNLGIQYINLANPSQPVNLGLEGSTLISIKDGGTCLFATDSSFIFKSNGYTNSWDDISLGLPPKNIAPIGQPENWIFPVNDIETLDNWVYSATPSGVFRSDINNILWTRVNNGLPAIANVQLLKEIDGNLYGGIVNDLFRSTDRGMSWMPLDEALSAISDVINYGNQLYYSTSGSGVFTSSDDGLNWVPINTGLTDLFVTSMAFMGNTLICGTKEQGVFYYDGTKWTKNLNGMICSGIWSLTTTPNSIIASTETEVFSSLGHSNSWQTITPSVAKHYFGSVVSMGNTVFLAYKDNTDKQMVKYTTDGTNWLSSPTSPNFTSDDTYKMVTNSNTLYAFDNGYLYSTDNYGSSWNDMSDVTGDNSNFNDFMFYNNVPFAAKNGNSELFRLDGSQWVSAANGLPPLKEVKSLAHSADAIYAYVQGEGIYVSRDNGSSWSLATDGYLSGFKILSYAYRDSSIFVTSDLGVFYSSNYGQNWYPMNEGIEGLEVGPLVIYNDSLFVGTMGNGIWKHDLDDFIPMEEIDTTIKVQHIKIYPNPASEYVRFEFDDFDKAQIKILNILGIEMINTKLNPDKQIAVNRLINGTYVIVITTDFYSYTTKLVIQR